MSTEYDWQQLREHAIALFGNQAPSADLEHDVVQVFAQNPNGVKQAIDHVGNEWAKGRITSPWAILRIQSQRLIDTSTNIIATDERARTKAIDKAEAWIRNAGIHIDRQAELIDYLFGHAEHTPPIEYLEQLENETREAPGRPIYGGLLEASIRRTREHGVQQIPDTQDGPLRHYRTVKLRNQMIAYWQERRHIGEQIELDGRERAEAWKHQHAQANAKPKAQAAA